MTFYNRKGSKAKGYGVRFCHHCNTQLTFKVGGGLYFTELLTPGDRYPVRVHDKCVDLALADGYKRPEPAQGTR